MILVLCPRDNFTKPFDLLEDRVGDGGPREGSALAVVVLDEVIDARYQVLDAAEAPPPDRSLGDDVEPDLHWLSQLA